MDIGRLFSLEGRRAVVTGASRGIGRAVALALAEAGADVALLARGREALEEAAAEVRAAGREALAVPCDVTDPAAVEGTLATIRGAWGRIDVLVNNAGINIRRRALEMTDADWTAVQEANLAPAFRMARGAAPLMDRGGSIINMGSVAGPVSLGTGAAYAASKAGMEGMTRALAAEWGRRGIRVNTIAPWYFPTPLTARLLANGRIRAAIEERTPLGRIGRLEEIAGTAVWLASDAGGYVTGQTIVLDGGVSIDAFRMFDLMESEGF